MKPYYNLEVSREASREIFSIRTTPIEVNWTHRKSLYLMDTCAKIKKGKNGKKGKSRYKIKEVHIIIQKDHMDPITKQIDVMDEKDDTNN